MRPLASIRLTVWLLALSIFLWLGSLPGKTAARRNHPQAEAINILGWVGLVFGGVGWVVAPTWAHMRPVFAPVGASPAAGTAATPEAPAEEAS
ncbi:MAG: DUF3302 domain-containing protein [Actinomycetia bacterium]|nr:DUF3302 domain-containing protein [Actinomycetes bacterium]